MSRGTLYFQYWSEKNGMKCDKKCDTFYLENEPFARSRSLEIASKLVLYEGQNRFDSKKAWAFFGSLMKQKRTKIGA